MISKTIGFRGLAYFQTHPFVFFFRMSPLLPRHGSPQVPSFRAEELPADPVADTAGVLQAMVNDSHFFGGENGYLYLLNLPPLYSSVLGF